MGVHAGHAGHVGHAGHAGHAGPVPSPGQAAVRTQQCSQVPSQGPKLFPPSSNPHADSVQVSCFAALQPVFFKSSEFQAKLCPEVVPKK